MHNVLKHKNMYLEGFQFILHFFSQSYVLDHFESIDWHIEKELRKKKKKTVYKKRFLQYGGRVRNNSFFLDVFPQVPRD